MLSSAPDNFAFLQAEETLRELNIPLDRHSHLKVKSFAYLKELLLYAKRQANENKEVAKSALCSVFPLLIAEEKKEQKQEIAEKAKRFMDGQYQSGYRVPIEYRGYARSKKD